MHSGENRELLALAEMVPARSAKIILDGGRALCKNAVMEKVIRKLFKAGGSTRVVLPRNMLLQNCWGDVSHVLIEAADKNTITIRRLIDGKSLKG